MPLLFDTQMDILKSYILNGWPERNKMASQLTIYHNMRDILSYEDGIILKGEAILIPSALREEITKRLHSAHMGYNSMICRARSLVFWPSMSRDIKQVVDNCAPCQELRPHNQKETLKLQDDDMVPGTRFLPSGQMYVQCTYIVRISPYIQIWYG